MANVDQSLDDFIKHNRSKFSNTKGRRRSQGRSFPTGRNRSSNNRIQKPVLSDARFKIIQHKREKLVDARDKLAELAKKTDAREKLDRIRGRKGQNNATPKQVRKGNITIRTSRNGRISLTTNKNSSYKHNEVDEDIQMSRNYQIKPVVSNPVQSFDVAPRYLCRTVDNKGSLPVRSPTPGHTVAADNSLYKWVKPSSPMREPLISRSARLEVSRRPLTLKTSTDSLFSTKSRGPLLLSEREEWNSPVKRPRPPTMYTSKEVEEFDDDEPMKKIGSLSQELKARLDGPDGFKVVVMNLHSSVSHDDIRELFEDIGPLVRSKLIRPGTAEVTFKHRVDAERSVDVYHNRQLDGQPMKCTLVPGSSAPVVSQSSLGKPGLRVPTGGSTFRLPTGGKSSVIPDIATIHKALFTKS